MKKIKIIIALALVAATAFSLTSCLSLDEAKAHHMKFTDDTFETISFAGKTYKKLPKSDTGCLFNTYLFGDETYWLTKEDVPVLLSKRYGLWSSYDSSHDIICSGPVFEGEYWSNGELDSDTAGGFFTTEEHYEEYKKMLDEPELVTFTTTVWEFDEELGKYSDKALTLPEDAAKLFDAEIRNMESGDLKNELSDDTLQQTFYRSSADGFVIDGTSINVISNKDGLWLVKSWRSYYRLSDETAKALEPYMGDNDNYIDYYEYYD